MHSLGVESAAKLDEFQMEAMKITPADIELSEVDPKVDVDVDKDLLNTARGARIEAAGQNLKTQANQPAPNTQITPQMQAQLPTAQPQQYDMLGIGAIGSVTNDVAQDVMARLDQNGDPTINVEQPQPANWQPQQPGLL